MLVDLAPADFVLVDLAPADFVLADFVLVDFVPADFVPVEGAAFRRADEVSASSAPSTSVAPIRRVTSRPATDTTSTGTSSRRADCPGASRARLPYTVSVTAPGSIGPTPRSRSTPSVPSTSNVCSPVRATVQVPSAQRLECEVAAAPQAERGSTAASAAATSRWAGRRLGTAGSRGTADAARDPARGGRRARSAGGRVVAGPVARSLAAAPAPDSGGRLRPRGGASTTAYAVVGPGPAGYRHRTPAGASRRG